MIDENGRDITVVRDTISAIIQSVELPRIIGSKGFLVAELANEIAERIIRDLPIIMTTSEDIEDGVS